MKLYDYGSWILIYEYLHWASTIHYKRNIFPFNIDNVKKIIEKSDMKLEVKYYRNDKRVAVSDWPHILKEALKERFDLNDNYISAYSL